MLPTTHRGAAPSPRRGLWCGLVALVGVVNLSCSNPSLPAADPPSQAITTDGTQESVLDTTVSTQVTSSAVATDAAPDAVVPPGVDVVIDTDLTVGEIDRRLLGTNVPAWLGPDRLGADWFRDAIVESGVSVIRMPGGSWSNLYDWLACELVDEDGCFWTWAARPSDFVELLAATDVEGMWTVNVNETAQQAAAAVAFFNGELDDQTVIGVDRHGVDWGRVAVWANLRAARGHPDPVGITLWEIGNEVFGGRPDAGGGECADFGWEDVWTCDGTAYALGDGEHDGYVAIRDAMLAVDPDIEVGAVGVADAGSWSNWGHEVIGAAGEQLDFYVVHQYGFDTSPSTPRDAVGRARELWPGVIESARAALADDVPIAITEYNLVAVGDADSQQAMTEVQNALYVADTIGQLAVHGVTIANHWNFANGTMDSGTDYGLIHADTGAPFPQYEAVATWGRAGAELLATNFAIDGRADVRVYATSGPDDDVFVILLHLSPEPTAFSLRFDGVARGADVVVESHWSQDATAVTFETTGPVASRLEEARLEIELQPWSLNVIEVDRG